MVQQIFGKNDYSRSPFTIQLSNKSEFPFGKTCWVSGICCVTKPNDSEQSNDLFDDDKCTRKQIANSPVECV